MLAVLCAACALLQPQRTHYAATASRARRVVSVAAGAGGWAEQGDWADESARAAVPGPSPRGRWLSVRGCDVLLPESGAPRAILHFVGGAFAGAAPQALYGAFLESLGADGFAIVATPCNLLVGLNHYAAAAEVAARWEAVSADLPSLLQPELMRSAGTAAAKRALPPVFGVGHSLGAKILVLLAAGMTEAPTASVRAAASAAGAEGAGAGPLGQRVANVLISYNNFPAARSVPMLQQARALAVYTDVIV